MLKSMTSSEITEWIAYFRIKMGMDKRPEKKIGAYQVLKAMFHGRIIKKKK